MAGKDNAIEFTEVKYFSRREMSNELGILIPEDMWKKVINYRQTYFNILSLKDAANKDMYLCLYPTLASQCNQLENKFLRLQGEMNNLNSINGDQNHFKLTCEANCLKAISDNQRMNLDLQRLKKVISSENPFDANEELLLNYHYALEFVKRRHVNRIDEDFLAELYSKLLGVEELTSFYRDSDIEDADSKSLVSRIYRSAPADKIEMMMERLFSFLENSNLSALNKAVITLYYVSYVKPFKENSELIANLLAKSVLAHYSLGELAIYLPLEELMNRRELDVKKMTQEVQSTADLTYFVSPSILDLSHLMDGMFNLLKEYAIKEIHQDFYQMEEETIELVPEVEEVKPVEEVKKVDIAPLKEENKQEAVKKEEKEEELPSPSKENIAITFDPNKLDEKELARLTEHLLEMDYNLKKKEAYFYARHCTLGMYYTIEQFRKCTRCVYETARTSMEHLVKLGYYEKKEAGKKFVYTPVKRK